MLYEQPLVQFLEFLADLLQLDVGDILHAMSFMQSIIHVPADNDTPIWLNHTALRDFLVDRTRSDIVKGYEMGTGGIISNAFSINGLASGMERLPWNVRVVMNRMNSLHW